METLLIKVSERKKANMLVELLKSMDFIDSVSYMNDFNSFSVAFDNVNKIASSSGLEEMTTDEINREIKEHRLGKKPGSN